MSFMPKNSANLKAAAAGRPAGPLGKVSGGNVDLSKHPKVFGDLKKLKGERQIDYGDLNGNTMSLLTMLITEGVLELKPPNPPNPPLTKEAIYEELFRIYNMPVDNLTAKDLANFEKILNAATVNKAAFVTLMGDDLADRGNNDYLTLLVYEKLGKSGANFDVIFSDHGADFLRYSESGFSKGFQTLFSGPTALGSMGHQGMSVTHLKKLVDKGLVSKDRLEEIVREQYLSHLKIVSCTIDEAENSISIKTHALVATGKKNDELENIKELAKTFKVPYDDSSIHALAATIDKINLKFYESALNKEITDKLQNEEEIMYKLQVETQKKVSTLEKRLEPLINNVKKTAKDLDDAEKISFFLEQQPHPPFNERTFGDFLKKLQEIERREGHLGIPSKNQQANSKDLEALGELSGNVTFAQKAFAMGSENLKALWKNKKDLSDLKIKKEEANNIRRENAPPQCPLNALIWRRAGYCENLPAKKSRHGYKIYNVHGHDNKGKPKAGLEDYETNLDTDVGAVPENPTLGEYGVRISHEKVPTPSPEIVRSRERLAEIARNKVKVRVAAASTPPAPVKPVVPAAVKPAAVANKKKLDSPLAYSNKQDSIFLKFENSAKALAFANELGNYDHNQEAYRYTGGDSVSIKTGEYEFYKDLLDNEINLPKIEDIPPPPEEDEEPPPPPPEEEEPPPPPPLPSQGVIKQNQPIVNQSLRFARVSALASAQSQQLTPAQPSQPQLQSKPASNVRSPSLSADIDAVLKFEIERRDKPWTNMSKPIQNSIEAIGDSLHQKLKEAAKILKTTPIRDPILNSFANNKAKVATPMVSGGQATSNKLIPPTISNTSADQVLLKFYTPKQASEFAKIIGKYDQKQEDHQYQGGVIVAINIKDYDFYRGLLENEINLPKNETPKDSRFKI